MNFAATQVSAVSAGDPAVGSLKRLAQGTLRIAQEWLAPVLDLGMRLFVAEAFVTSGLTKIASWDTTVALFENEYQVPLLPPELAAYLGTAAELTLPVFVALGLGGRVAAIALFLFNIVAVIAYPDLSPAGLKDHQLWGLILLVVALHGPGKLSLDHLIRRRFLA
ncbi:MAG: DoxX family protein [Candidatus Methylophosphatis roskildensis]